MKKIKKEDLIVNPKTVGNDIAIHDEFDTRVHCVTNPYDTQQDCDTKTRGLFTCVVMTGCIDATYNTVCLCVSNDICVETEGPGCNYSEGNCIHTKSNTPVCCDETQQGANCQESVYVCVATSLAIDECTGTIPDSTGCDSPIESSDDTDCEGEGEGEEEDTDTFYC
ncbi:MAG: hypothetical protein J1F10_07745 [Muribaculaceae bacterium]|nr:hypothetical protein [Muribaculaceae bacterium]